MRLNLTSDMILPKRLGIPLIMMVILRHKKRKMTLCDFNKLPLPRKSEMLWEWGFYLINSKRNNTNTVLFMVNDFFVEMRMNISEGKAESITAVNREELNAEQVKSINRRKPLIGKRLFGFEITELPAAA